ncbi:hypothetical protein KC323_g6761 [Hortaea werneckii]|uniref:Uncharacterized protein n=2 Tax=Hortaea werneckii TaxID=91943 RepID=A0A3M7F6T3_HORWE|nr:hypothetical protein KC323_g6761 [Hortaea werneckii]KAI7348196.1 hypothetical protein KC320_g6799 [Hortaea werneckii]RMY84231.1 hypothetical protein D0862_11471 [Hortaea werneckii]
MRVFDYDLREVFLGGIDTSYVPSKARRLVEERSITLYPEDKVQGQLRAIAVCLHKHRDLMPWAQAGAPTDNNDPASKYNVARKSNLAHLVCGLYEVSLSVFRGEERPRLRNSMPLPLGNWDQLYYAVTAQIRLSYSALEQEYGREFGNGKAILAEAGSRQPLSAVCMAEMLEEMWGVLTDYRLIAALDDAVRLRRAQEKLAALQASYETPTSGQAMEPAEGLLDVNAMAPTAILEMVLANKTQENTSGRASAGTSLLSDCTAEVLEDGSVVCRSSQQSLEPATCTCQTTCDCRPRHFLNEGYCACAAIINEAHDSVNEEDGLSNTKHQYDDADRTLSPTQVLDVISNQNMSTKDAFGVYQSPFTTEAFQANEFANQLDRNILEMRSAVANPGEGARSSGPAPKDAYPLGYYGGGSSQRQPASRKPKDAYPLGFYGGISSQHHTASRTNDAATGSGQQSQLPRRKPVPLPLPVVPSQTAPTYDSPFQSHATWQSSGPSTQGANYVYGRVQYPAIPQSQSQDQFTQSFPVGARGYPPDTDTDNTFSAADYTQLADEAQDAIRPFTDTDTEPLLGSSSSPQAVRPSLHGTVTSPDALEGRRFRKARRDGRQTQQPLLPEPEFISPRPATKQRYVSAGGNAKLHERQEIEGPAFSFHTGGASMSKDEVDHKLKDRDFIRSTFGAAAAEMAMSAERSSRESAGHADKRESKAGSSKKSKDEVGKYQKRGRGESGASKGNAAATLAKLKKKFSRKGSECE